MENESARKLLQCFGIPAGTVVEHPDAADDTKAILEVRSDPSFGPLLCLTREGKAPIVRITPLTDHDVREIVSCADIPSECGVEELLGRISQLIEELPWLCTMFAKIYRTGQAPEHCHAVLGSDARLGFCHPNAATRNLGLQSAAGSASL
jgi:hypothetical protein